MNFGNFSRLAAGVAACAASVTAAHATLTISKKATQNVSCSGGVCMATAKKAVLNATDLVHMLGSGDVTIVPGKTAGDIDVAAAVAWGSAHRLTLDSYTGVLIEQSVTVQGTAGLTVTTNDGGHGGSFSFSPNGNVTFLDLASSLVVNAASYTLVGDIATLASDIKNNASLNYALAASYNAKPDGTYKTPPVTTVFGGQFEGLGNAISNLKIAIKKAKSYTGSPWLGQAGLFAGVTGTIENIVLAKASVRSGDLTNAGILVGELYGNVLNATSSGSVSVGNGVAGGQVISPDAGGLVGAVLAAGQVANASSSATVTAGDSGLAGGLIGGIYTSASVLDSTASGTVAAGNNILGTYQGGAGGGLIGLIDVLASGTVQVLGSSATGSVQVGNNQGAAGGLIGAMGGSLTIQDCFATGAASVGDGSSTNGYSTAGGLVAFDISSGNTASVARSYATGPVTGTTIGLIGGLVGYSVGTVEDSYAAGTVSAPGGGNAVGGTLGDIAASAAASTSYSTGVVNIAGSSYFGGFVGNTVGAQSDAYWDTTTSGIANLAQGAGNEANAPGIAGLTTAQFQSGLPSGFSPAIWAEASGINGGLPYLKDIPPGANAPRHVLPALARGALPKSWPRYQGMNGPKAK